MGQAHARRDLYPAWIVGQILVRPVLIRKNWIGTIRRKRLVQVVLKWGVEFEFALIHHLHYGVSENRLGHRRSVHDSVGSQRITFGVADPIGMDVSDFAVI